MIKLILFDLGGVIIKIPDNENYDRLGKISGTSSANAECIVKEKAESFESGKITLSEFEKRIAKDLSIKPREVRWLQFFKEMAKPDNDMVKLVIELKRNYMVAYLSNADRWRYGHVKNHVISKFAGLFDYKFVSYKLGCVKPYPLIYKKTLAKLKLEPSEVIFIDNIPKNVAGARAVGINSIIFTGIKKLESDLKRRGIKFNQV
ncbi:MAG: HAD family hydrolase [Candidatus Micrarchaeaceae archaeon]